jgi:hypothetical protein
MQILGSKYIKVWLQFDFSMSIYVPPPPPSREPPDIELEIGDKRSLMFNSSEFSVRFRYDIQ